MNELIISKRLETVASYVNKGAKIADIGSDHAYLPVYLVSQGIADYAIAGEVNKGPLQAAENQVKKYGYEEQIKTKLGNGLAVLEGEVIDTVTIAGMGGPLIADILEGGKEHLTYIERLILQPNIAADRIRAWLIENNWQLIDEEILKEDGHIYEVLVAEPGDPLFLYGKNEVEKKVWLGPKLSSEKNNAFLEKWTKEHEQLEKIKVKLSEASAPNIESKQSDIEKKITWLKEELS
ncbi:MULTISPECIES: tRNA (adenine(22)-N(1))-methyltransferase [Bacillaceae]|uniref:tRNA (Adenine(22)-N(1))-methyltransferase TrmK n=1 Tax=Evansella alkalicola TaxID=745819 RepID=A0ABS6JV74_9BACI|nr:MULTISPECIES: tRNA (adenine(22)-N(1))-methyltransferase TrmK [Bacillaceae]MBU9722483.1 tRNA (adenine(22)-N(1))-methyltransferase TrmK [Bacillus alkalicola]